MTEEERKQTRIKLAEVIHKLSSACGRATWLLQVLLVATGDVEKVCKALDVEAEAKTIRDAFLAYGEFVNDTQMREKLTELL
jgi:hypothetical protein